MRKFLAILFLLCTVSLGFVPLPGLLRRNWCS